MLVASLLFLRHNTGVLSIEVINVQRRRGSDGRPSGEGSSGGAFRRWRPGFSAGKRPGKNMNKNGSTWWPSGECFPASALVLLSSGVYFTMSRLRVGDDLFQVSTKPSPIFVFSHSDETVNASFVRLLTPNGSLTVTKGHYVYTSVGLQVAGNVRQGDSLQTTTGSTNVVVDVKMVHRLGLFNPHTLSGEMVVDGFRVSSYTTFIKPIAATGLLVPLRAIYRTVKVDVVSVFLKFCGSTLFWVAKLAYLPTCVNLIWH